MAHADVQALRIVGQMQEGNQVVVIVERFADRSVRRFGVGTRIKQRLRNIGVVAPGRAVQRRPAVLAVTAAVVGIGTARDQEADNLGTVRPVPRPVRGDVQQRPAP